MIIWLGIASLAALALLGVMLWRERRTFRFGRILAVFGLGFVLAMVVTTVVGRLSGPRELNGQGTPAAKPAAKPTTAN